MIYLVLADLTTLVHFAFVLFVILGGLLALRWPKLAWVHLPAAGWGAFVEFSGRICPLTPLEVWLREQGGAEAYSGGFVEQYLIPVLYPAGLNQDMQLALGTAVVLINLVIYGWLWRRLAKARYAGDP